MPRSTVAGDKPPKMLFGTSVLMHGDLTERLGELEEKTEVLAMQ